MGRAQQASSEAEQRRLLEQAIAGYRMAETGFTRMPVVERDEDRKLVGMISLEDLLHARTRNLTEERSRERVLRIRLPFGGWTGRPENAAAARGHSKLR